MRTPTFKRTDTFIENVLGMLRPILDELDLIGRTIPATELARICRNRISRLPLRGYNGLRMAEEIHFLGHNGSIIIGDMSVQAIMEMNHATRRRQPLIAFEHYVWEDEKITAEPKDGEAANES